MKPEPSFSRRVDPASIVRDGERFPIEANEEERTALAGALGLVALSQFYAELELSRAASGVVTAKGRLRAQLTQSCVVTLAPVEQAIDHLIARRFAPQGERKTDIVVDVAPEGDEPPDEYGRGGIDLGAFVLEELILAIDPYPRAPDAALPENADEAGGDDRESPFAVLKTFGHRGGS